MFYVIIIFLVITLGLVALDRLVATVGHRRIIEPFQAAEADAIIVPGAKINPDGSPTDMLKDRLDAAIALYASKRAPLILVSGDGRDSALNETASMAAYLKTAGIPAAAIVIDPEGYDTFQTVLRSKDAYAIRSSIIVTQTFHLERALFIANALDSDMMGVASDFRDYASMPLMRLREVAARVKALYECAVFGLTGS